MEKLTFIDYFQLREMVQQYSSRQVIRIMVMITLCVVTIITVSVVSPYVPIMDMDGTFTSWYALLILLGLPLSVGSITGIVVGLIMLARIDAKENKRLKLLAYYYTEDVLTKNLSVITGDKELAKIFPNPYPRLVAKK